MTQYKYTALNLQQEKFKGVFIAADEEDLAVQLQKQGLFLVSAKPYSGTVKKGFFSFSVGGSVKQTEINQFSRQLAIMINSGISLLDALDILKDQNFSKMFCEILYVITDDVRSGLMFSDALKKHKKVFPNFFRSMVRIGETSGKMGAILTSLADYYEHNAKTKKNIKSAMAYPLFLFVLTIGIVLVMMLWIIPTFRESLASLEITVTGITKVVYDASDFFLANYLYILYVVVGLVLILFVFSRTKTGKISFDKFKLHGPVIGKIMNALITSRFARSFALLLSAGMDIVESLEACLIVFDSYEMEGKFKKAISEVKRGVTLSKAFSDQNMFPAIMVQMISVGEKTNSLDQVLIKSTVFFDDMANDAITSATSKIQPIMLIIMGCIVGVTFMAIYGPMLDMMTQIA